MTIDLSTNLGFLSGGFIFKGALNINLSGPKVGFVVGVDDKLFGDKYVEVCVTLKISAARKNKRKTNENKHAVREMRADVVNATRFA